MNRTVVAAAAILAVVLSALATAQRASELFERALVQEHANGHLEEAIGLYQQAASRAGSDRGLAARALIRAAGACEKLGRLSDATRIYGNVMRVYPEQRAEVATAQARLTAMRRGSPSRPAPAPTPGVSDVSTVTAPLFQRYCVQCHNATVKTAGLDVTSLDDRNVGGNTAIWETIVRRLQARRDPPSGAPRPDDRTYRAVISRVQQALDAAYSANRTLTRAERVTDNELAARLAMFLWKDAPDAPLLDDARNGRLHDPAILNRHVIRMLRDQRSATLVDTFFAPWLQLDRLKTSRPDPAVYPQVDADLLQAMDTETRLFLASQLREDHDAAEIWTANYTFVNERLARHYGLPGISGREFRRVTWPDPSRGGLLGQASILTIASMPARTSPTQRGRYVLTHFLGVDAPNPPANVPALPERPPTRGAMRDRMQAHKVNPSCASCHAIFDPMGLALENFDATGAWRSTDGGATIDATEQFIDGTRFNGPAGLRAGLLKYRDAYYTSVTQQLLAYALGRTGKAGRVYDYEMPAVRRIVREAVARNDRWSSIFAGIAASTPFQMKNTIP
jgi:hypothetical protein